MLTQKTVQFMVLRHSLVSLLVGHGCDTRILFQNDFFFTNSIHHLEPTDSNTPLRLPLSPFTFPLSLKAPQPPGQRISKVLSTHRSARKRRPEIKAMLRILHHIPKYLTPSLSLSTRGGFSKLPYARRKRLRAKRRQSAPGVEFAAAPVCVGGADVPAAEDGVCACGIGPGGKEGGGRGGELAVADVALVGEGVEF